MSSHYTWGSVDHTYMCLEVWWDGLRTRSFGLSQFHGHSSWLVCEVALISILGSQIIQLSRRKPLPNSSYKTWRKLNCLIQATLAEPSDAVRSPRGKGSRVVSNASVPWISSGRLNNPVNSVNNLRIFKIQSTLYKCYTDINVNPL